MDAVTLCAAARVHRRGGWPPRLEDQCKVGFDRSLLDGGPGPGGTGLLIPVDDGGDVEAVERLSRQSGEGREHDHEPRLHVGDTRSGRTAVRMDREGALGHGSGREDGVSVAEQQQAGGTPPPRSPRDQNVRSARLGRAALRGEPQGLELASQTTEHQTDPVHILRAAVDVHDLAKEVGPSVLAHRSSSGSASDDERRLGRRAGAGVMRMTVQ